MVKRERFFKVVDDLIDNGDVDVVKEVRSNVALRKRCQRLFPPKGGKSSTTLALEAYGFYFDTIVPTREELEDCLFIDDSYKVSMNEVKFNELISCCNLEENELCRLLKPIKKELALDALSYFVSDHSPELISYKKIREFPHLRSYINNIIGRVEDFRQMFNVDYRLPFYDNPSKEWIFISSGLHFEELLEKHLFGSDGYQVVYKDSIPDFIVNGEWIDAKLSKGTALDSRDNTISKYLKHTESLKIIYAYEDGTDTSEIEDELNVSFVHVSKYYDKIPLEAIMEFEDLIRRISVLKDKATK